MRISARHRAVWTAALVLWAAGSGRALTNRFRDLSDAVPSDKGKLSIQVTFSRDLSSDPHDHVFLLAVSSDGSERYELLLMGEQLIARRYFGGCFLSVNAAPYHFLLNQSVSLELAWNNATTRFSINGVERPGQQLIASHDLGKLFPGVRLGIEDGFVSEGFQTSAQTDVWSDAADRETVARTACPNLIGLVNEPAQAVHRQVQLHHFPDAASRDRIKGYLDLLPEAFVRSIHHVVYMEDARAPKTGEGGEMDSKTMSVFLKGSYYDDPQVFFHEAGHAYDAAQHLALGVPEEKSEWVAIAGSHCYYKGSDIQRYLKEFERTHVANGFLGGQGGQCPPEDLAEWVAAAYDAYLHERTLRDLLHPSGSKYGPKNRQKLDFLMRKGFFTPELYAKVTAGSNP